MPVEPLINFRGLPSNTDLNAVDIPEVHKNRRCTDIIFLLVFLISICAMLPFLGIGLTYGDSSRFFGYDQCGNVCGKKNENYSEWTCTGKDFTKFRYLQIDATLKDSDKMSREQFLLTPRKCVKKCEEGYEQSFSFCYQQPKNRDVSRTNWFHLINSIYYMKHHYIRVTMICVFALLVGLVTLYVFEMFTRYCVYVSIPAVLMICVFIFGFLWYFYKHYDKFVHTTQGIFTKEEDFVLFLVIFFSTLFVVIFFLTLVFYKRIKLVILLLYEAVDAVYTMPLLMAVPITVFFLQCLLIAVFIYATLTISTSGNLKQLKYDAETHSIFLYYHMGSLVIFTLLLNTWIFVWMFQFIMDLQYIIIAGAVSKWYWSPDKNKLIQPVIKSMLILFRYHLGSVAFGSMVISVFGIFRLLLFLVEKTFLKNVFMICFRFAKYLSRQAYIVVAMHGRPFYNSGKRASMIIFYNFMNIISIKFVSGFIIYVFELWIVMASLLFAMLMLWGTAPEYTSFAYFIITIVSGVVAVAIFGLFDTVIDTLFICFCEDTLINDGKTRPYAMSPGLSGFMEKSSPIWRKTPAPS